MEISSCVGGKYYCDVFNFSSNLILLKSVLFTHSHTTTGFVYALQGNAILAVEYCHKALDKERQDPFTIQLLEMSLTALAGLCYTRHTYSILLLLY